MIFNCQDITKLNRLHILKKTGNQNPSNLHTSGACIYSDQQRKQQQKQQTNKWSILGILLKS